MHTPVVSKSYKVRALVFAAVLLVSGMLVFTLLQEAQSAYIDVAEIGTVSGGTATITAEIVIPEAEVLPVVGVAAVIETNDDQLTTKQGHIPVDLVERADCGNPTLGCGTNQPRAFSAKTGPKDNVVTSIAFNGFFQIGTGYDVTSGYWPKVGTFTDQGGYGYHPTAGFGYLGQGPGGGGPTTGYGYGDGGLLMRYTITINPNNLGQGTYWFTLAADTGSGIQPGLHSSAQSFTVGATPGGGGGGGGGGSPGTGTPSVPTTVPATSIPAPEGALEAWRAAVTGERGQTITIQTGSEKVPKVDFTLDADVSDANIEVVVWPPDATPPGVNAPPWTGTRGAFFIQITIDAGGTDHSVEIFVQIADADMENEGDENRAFGAKHTNPWNVEGKVDLTHNADEARWEGSFTSTCCSVFMVGFDDEDPTVSLNVPASPLFGMVTLTAEADDNVELDRVEFFVGNTLIGTATSAPYTVQWDSTQVADGDYTFRAEAYDIVGNSAEGSEERTVDQGDEPGIGPGDDDETETSNAWLWILLIVLAIVVIGGIILFNKNKKSG